MCDSSSVVPRKRPVLAFVAVVLLPGCTRSNPNYGDPGGRYADEVFTEHVVTRDLEYGSAFNVLTEADESLLLDLYEPADERKTRRAAVVMIHGGGFVAGDKADVADFCTTFALRGYVCAAINYRLEWDQTEPPPPDLLEQFKRHAMEDAKASIRWLRANAKKYRTDAERIGVAGVSAGAITALRVAYFEASGESGNPDFSSEVSAVASISGALQELNEMDGGEAPLVMVHGQEDPVVPFVDALVTLERAEEVGNPHEHLWIEKGGHGVPPDLLDDVHDLIANFFFTHVTAR